MKYTPVQACRLQLPGAYYDDVFARDMVNGSESRVDFAMAEALAFGTLLLHQGVAPPGVTLGQQEAYFDPALGLNKGHYSVRLTGQDVARGTFGQRHAVIVDTVTGQRCARAC